MCTVVVSVKRIEEEEEHRGTKTQHGSEALKV